jgi:hypothetical protein
MMMGSTTITSATITESLALINAMLDPQMAKRVLEELDQKVEAFNKARDEATAAQKQAEQAQADANAAMAQLADREAALAEREASVAVRAAQFEKTRAEIKARVAGELT